MPFRQLMVLSATSMVALLAIVALIYVNRMDRPSNLAANPPALLLQVQKLNELVSVKYSVQKVICLEEQKQPFGSERILLIVQAKVAGGIDLGRLQKGNFTREPNGGYKVRLPEAQILYVAIDERETKVWDRQVTWWTPWVPYNNDLERRARLAATEEIKKSAIEMGILTDARRQAEVAIRNLLLAFGVTDIVFRNAT